MLSSHLPAKEMSDTSVALDLLHSLKIFSHSGIPHVGEQVDGGSVFRVSFSVQEPLGNVVLWY
jgi:hypothetical protein